MLSFRETYLSELQSHARSGQGWWLLMRESPLICGIDFSASQRNAGAHTWITTGVGRGRTLEVVQCLPAKELPGSGRDRTACMTSVRRFIAEQPHLVAGLDFPFGLPQALVP